MRRRVLIIIGYLLGTAFVVGGTFLLIAYGKGYSYNFKTGKLVHRGLIIIESRPSGATIDINGKRVRHKTPYHETLDPGWYSFTLAKSGYKTWTKKLQSVPAEATLAQYVMLLADHLQVDSIGTYPNITQTAISRDHDRIAYVVAGDNGGGIWSLDTNNNRQMRIYASALASDSAPSEIVQVIAWSNDNSHLLIKSQIGDAVAYKLISVTPTDSQIDLTAAFQVNTGTLVFDPSNWRTVYWQSPEGLRRINAGDQTISSVLAENVVATAFAGNRLLYVSLKDAPAVWELDNDGSKKRLINNLPPSASYQLSYANYIGTPHLAVAVQDQNRAVLYKDIFNKPMAVKLKAPTKGLAFNGDGRFILQWDETHVATYDLQRKQTLTFDAENSAVTNLDWFDNYHVIFNRGDQIVLSEFDGNYANVITRGTNLPGYSVSGGKEVITNSLTSNGSALLKSITIRD